MDSTTHSQPESTLVGAKFTGDSKTYFNIWIVNIFLTIITLGIYSAWATVRNRRYFYGNTSIANHRFEYHGKPIQILKGRAIAFVLFAIYMVCSVYLPLVAALIALVIMIATPWLVNQSLRFNLRMTSYRNVRFSFKGTYGEAFTNFIVFPFLSVFTLHLMLPYVIKRIDMYIHNNISYGNQAAQVELSTKEYYKTVFICVIAGLGMVLVLMLIGFLMSLALASAAVLIPVGFVALNLVFVSFIAALYQGRIRNHIFNHANIGQVAELHSNVDEFAYAKLLVVNAFAIVFSFGLAFPWAKVRKAEFLAQATGVTFTSDIDHVVNTMVEEQSAFGEEASNFLDVDLSIG